MSEKDLVTDPNPDLAVVRDNKPRWNTPDFRRHGFHNLHRLARYSTTYRAGQVLRLEKSVDPRIGDREDLRRLTASVHFSGMVIARGQDILYEAYAPDFGPDQPHTIMSITKTCLNFIIGGLVRDGKINLSEKVAAYLPEIGSGYATATVQQVLNMDVANDYSEDYADPFCSSYQHELPMGWRLPAADQAVPAAYDFLAAISSADITNTSGAALYKSANTDVLGWIAERVSGRRLGAYFADIADAAGMAGGFHLTTDRNGLPWASGGGCLTARDLARLGLLFARRGRGANGGQVGCPDFIESSRRQTGPAMPDPRDWINYSNQTMTNGRWLGHGGYGGQFMLADLDSGVVGAFFSVLENDDAHHGPHSVSVIRMLEDIAAT